MSYFKVTEKLHQTWQYQLEQMREERLYTQSGRRRSPEDVAIVDFEIKVQEYLLTLPLGAKFNAQEIRKMLGEKESESHEVVE